MLLKFFTRIHLNRYEEKIIDTNRLPLKFRSLLADTTRLTRLQSRETSLHQQVIWNTTASAIAPILFGFVYWCLVEAQKKGIQRLYFVARDGQILQRIALVISQNWGFAIDCRYLYGSRQAWYMPAIQEVGKDELDWILWGTQTCALVLSIRSVCDRLNILPEQIQDVLSRYGFPAAKWNINLPQSDRNLLKQVFTEKEVTDLIISTAAIHRKKAIGYFCQEGLNDGVSYGVVDIGWGGNVQRSLSKLLGTAGFYPEFGVCGFYFALERQVKTFQSDRLLAYFEADQPLSSFLRKYRCFVELFVAADHGSTIGYDRCGDRYIPVLRFPTNEAAINWGLYTLQNATIEFAKQITNHLNQQDCTTDLFLETAQILVREIVLNPSRQEAQVFGTFVMSGDMTENVFYELAPKYSLVDWVRLLLYDRHPHADVWFPASVVKAHFIVRNLFKFKEFSVVRKLRKSSRLGKLKQKFLLHSQTN